jgi:hypothetical protein
VFLTLFHGSDHIVDTPTFGAGKLYNDYGRGFYCTEHLDMACEWAVGFDHDGFANEYRFDQDGLRIVDLNDAEIKLKNSVFNTRTLERGSAIVTCSGIKLVLQMPRGNLETVNLRLVVFDEVKKLILNKKYDEAFYICKKNKINLNFLYDLNPNLFMNNLSIFVSKIKTDDINLFINSLTNEKCDEIKILFNEHEKETNIEKINEICCCASDRSYDTFHGRLPVEGGEDNIFFRYRCKLC